MASSRRFEITLPAVNGGADYGVLTEKAPIYPYENNKRVSDTPIGVRLTLALPGARMGTLTIKYDHDPLPKISDAEIAAACTACSFLYVQIPDATVTLYSAEGGIGMTATAQTAQIVTLNSK